MNPALIEQSARGMIRNFGAEAGEQARAIAGRYARAQDSEGCGIWTAIAEAVTQLTTAAKKPDRVPQS